MNRLTIDLGGGPPYLAPLYSLSNGSSASDIEQSVARWFQQTLTRDGYAHLTLGVRVSGDSGEIVLTAPTGEEFQDESRHGSSGRARGFQKPPGFTSYMGPTPYSSSALASCLRVLAPT